MGNALFALGERDANADSLKGALAAYRDALKEFTREGAPLLWAKAQNNLGNTLNRLGERDAGSALLEDALGAYRSALEIRTLDKFPVDWALTENNLGTALYLIGEREKGTTHLEEARVIYEKVPKPALIDLAKQSRLIRMHLPFERGSIRQSNGQQLKEILVQLWVNGACAMKTSVGLRRQPQLITRRSRS
jgi:tetratricopeptide (TPR) repeat protein